MSNMVNTKVRYINYRTWACNGCGAHNDHNDGSCQFCNADHECYVRGTTEVREGVPPLCDKCKQPMVNYWNGLAAQLAQVQP